MGCPRVSNSVFDKLRKMKEDIFKAVEEEKKRMDESN
jgi:hypothetical protein